MSTLFCPLELAEESTTNGPTGSGPLAWFPAAELEALAEDELEEHEQQKATNVVTVVGAVVVALGLGGVVLGCRVARALRGSRRLHGSRRLPQKSWE